LSELQSFAIHHAMHVACANQLVSSLWSLLSLFEHWARDKGYQSAEYQADEIVRNHPHVPFLGDRGASWKGELAIQVKGIGDVFYKVFEGILCGKGF